MKYISKEQILNKITKLVTPTTTNIVTPLKIKKQLFENLGELGVKDADFVVKYKVGRLTVAGYFAQPENSFASNPTTRLTKMKVYYDDYPLTVLSLSDSREIINELETLFEKQIDRYFNN
jgi:hypothetical protein